MIQPVGDRVLIKLTVQEKESSGGSLDKILTGDVLAVGEGSRTSYGNLIPPTVKVGDKVLFGQYSGLDKWEEDGEDLYIIPDKEIRAIIED